MALPPLRRAAVRLLAVALPQSPIEYAIILPFLGEVGATKERPEGARAPTKPQSLARYPDRYKNNVIGKPCQLKIQV